MKTKLNSINIKIYLLKIVLSVTIYLFFSLPAFGQDGYYPYRIGESNANNRNVNFPDGTKLQDLKRSTGQFYNVVNGEVEDLCSCNLVNNVKQDGTVYVSTAAHCVKDYEVDELIDTYLSFDYEMAHATKRGNKNDDITISTYYKVTYKILFKNTYSDLALLELVEDSYNLQLLEYTYAAGWDNTLESGNKIWSNISHPQGDHKKVFINPNKIKLNFLDLINKYGERFGGFLYRTRNRWNERNTTPENGSSGSGDFSKKKLLTAVVAMSVPPVELYSSAISNRWYGKPTESSYFAKYLDPNNSWLNKLPGGYINDLVQTDENNNFELLMLPGDKKVTPSVVVKKPTKLHKDVLWLKPKIFYESSFLRSIDYKPPGSPIWIDLLGLKVENFSYSDLVLSVYYLDQDPVSGLYTERLLYGTHVDNNSETSKPIEFGFKKGEAWDCDNPPPNYPLCNRLPSESYFSTKQLSTDIKNEYLKALRYSKDGNLVSLTKTKIPIRVRLDNIGSYIVNVQAVSYPGDIPKNALQLFHPEEVWKKFKSYKYKPSRGENSNQLYINSIKVALEQYVLLPEETTCTALPRRTLKEIATANNGGYLNLVNPNFLIDDIVASDERCEKNKLILTVNTSNIITGTNRYYGAWLDYYKDRKGANNTDPQDDYTYNFVNDIDLHPEEQLDVDSKTGSTIIIEHEVPYAKNLPFDDGNNEIKTRLRIAVADQPQSGEINLTQGSTYNQGEVEDYLVRIRQTSEEDKQLSAIINNNIPIILMIEGAENNQCDTTDLGGGIDETDPEQNLPFHGGACGNILDSTNNNIGKNAILFNGSMYIGVAEGGSLVHTPSSKKTISIDFLKESINTNQDEILYEEGGADNGFSIRLKGNKIEFGVKITGQLIRIESLSEIALNQMINATAVFNEGVLKLYINGELEATNTQFSSQENSKTSIPEHLNDAGLGGTVGTTIWKSLLNNFNGIVDYFAYWDGALTATTIGILATRIPSSNNNARGIIVASNTKPPKIVKEEKKKEPDFSIFPNPVKDELNILVEVTQAGPLKIEITDLTGKKVYETMRANINKGHQIIELRNLNLASSTYLFSIQAGNVKRKEKIVVE